MKLFHKCAFFKFQKFHLYMHLSIVELACDNQFLKLSDELDTSYWTKYHMEMMGHMPMFTQKLSEIFHFFDLDQISHMCSFGVSIGFFWIPEG